MKTLDKMIEFLQTFEEECTEQKYIDYIEQYKTRTTGAGIVNILNKLVSMIDEDKCYLEVGVHKGSTLVGASLDNATKCYGVDNFSGHNLAEEAHPFATVKENLEDRLSRWAGRHNASFFESDYLTFSKDRNDIEGKKVQVYFYDGDHGQESTYLGLKHYTTLLNKESIVLLDDSANNDGAAVWEAVRRVLKEDNRFSVIKEWIPQKMHGHMWCGLIALKFEEKNE